MTECRPPKNRTFFYVFFAMGIACVLVLLACATSIQSAPAPPARHHHGNRTYVCQVICVTDGSHIRAQEELYSPETRPTCDRRKHTVRGSSSPTPMPSHGYRRLTSILPPPLFQIGLPKCGTTALWVCRLYFVSSLRLISDLFQDYIATHKQIITPRVPGGDPKNPYVSCND